MSGAIAYHVVKLVKEKATRIEECNTCAYFDPRAYHCSKYLREVETAVYLCPFCRKDENEEMSECPNCGADMRPQPPKEE